MESAEFELKQWLLQLPFLRGDGLWVSEAFLIILIAMTLNLIQKRVICKIYDRLEKTKNPWDEAFVESLAKPISAFIWLWGITIAANVIADAQNVSVYDEIVRPARQIGIIVILTWTVLRIIVRIERNIVKIGRDKDPAYDVTTVQAITKLIRVSVFITGTLIMLQELGVSVSGVLAFGGIGGMAIGFAAKDLLSNFFGGLMLYLDRPFAVGDWIRSPDRNIEGTVENIGWRNHNEIDTAQTLMVNFNEFAPSSLDFFIYTFTKTTNWVKYHKVKQDVLFQIMTIIEKHGAEMAFPTSTLHMNGRLEQAGLEAEGQIK